MIKMISVPVVKVLFVAFDLEDLVKKGDHRATDSIIKKGKPDNQETPE